MSMKEATGEMLRGMLMTAVFAALLLTTPFLPSGLGVLVLLLLPAIPALQAITHRFTMAVCFAFLGTSTISLFSEGMMLASIWFYCLGLGLGWGFKYQRSLIALFKEEPNHTPHLAADQVLVPGFCGAMIGTLILTLMIPGMTGIAILPSLETALDTIGSQMWELPNVDPEIVHQALVYLESARAILQENLVFLLCSMALCVTLLSYYFTRFVLRRMGTSLPDLPGFSHWELPSRIVMILLITFFPAFMSIEINTWPLVFLNSLNQLLLMLCAFVGLAVIDYFLLQRRWPSWLRCLLRPILYVAPMMSTVLILIGMLDISFDMRKLHRIVS